MFGAIQPEQQFWSSPQAQAVCDFMPDVRFRGIESFQTALCFLVIAFDIDQNLRGATVIRHLHTCHTDQADARIAEFALDEGFDLLA